MRPVVIAGCGDLGIAVGTRLLAAQRPVLGLRRNSARVPGPLDAVDADLTREPGDGGIDPDELPKAAATLLYAVTPDARTEESYDRIYREALVRTVEVMPVPPARIVFVSSTAVYDIDDGSWVHEATPTNATGTGGVLVASELAARATGIPTTAVRATGIYGPGRTALIDRVRSGEAVFHEEEPVYTNRIHRDDLANLIAALIVRSESETIPDVICAVDDEPAPRTDVNHFIAELIGVVPRTSADHRPRARGNKRVRSRYQGEFGPGLLRPTYREGYRALVGEGR